MALDLTDLDKIDRIVRTAVKDAIEPALADDEPVELAGRWEGGKLEIWPRDPALGAKEIPIDAFFHKIVMLRDRLRVLEQQINGHAKLRERDIATIFYLAEAGYRQQWIADAFSVSQSLVSRILNGNRWKPVYTSAKVKPARSGARPVEIPPWLWFSPRLTRRQGDRGPEGLRSP